MKKPHRNPNCPCTDCTAWYYGQVKRLQAIVAAQKAVLNWWHDESEMSCYDQDELPESLRELLDKLRAAEAAGGNDAISTE